MPMSGLSGRKLPFFVPGDKGGQKPRLRWGGRRKLAPQEATETSVLTSWQHDRCCRQTPSP